MVGDIIVGLIEGIFEILVELILKNNIYDYRSLMIKTENLETPLPI